MEAKCYTSENYKTSRRITDERYGNLEK